MDRRNFVKLVSSTAFAGSLIRSDRAKAADLSETGSCEEEWPVSK